MSPAGIPPPRPDRRETLAAACVGTLVFLAHAAAARWVFLPAEQFLKYPGAADLLLRGELPLERFFDFSPLYLLLHAAARAVLPDPGPALVALQSGMTAGAAVFLFLILRRCVSLPLAAIGAGMLAATPGVVLYGYLYEPEACVLFLLTGFVWSVPRPGRAGASAGAVLFALLVLTRPSFLPLALLPLLEPGAQGGWRRRLARTAVVAAPVAALLLLAAVLAPGRGWMPPPVMNPGQVFFEGNSPFARGQNAVYPPLVEELQPVLSTEPDSAHLVYRTFARRIGGAALTAAGANRYWAGKAAAYIRDHPGAHLRHLARKTLLIFHEQRRHEMLAAHRADRRLRAARVPVFPFALLAALGVAGLAASLGAWRTLLPFYAVLAHQSALLLALYVSERQRLPLAPVLAVFACVGAAHLPRRHLPRAAYAAAVIAGTVALNLPTAAAREGTHAWESFDASSRALALAVEARAGEALPEAARAALSAAAADPLRIDQLRPSYLSFGSAGFAAGARSASARPSPDDLPARFDDAILLYESGAVDAAAAAFAALRREGYRPLRRGATPVDLDYHLARCDLARGDRAGARARLERALAANPGDPHLLALLLALTSERRYGRELFRYLDEIDAAFLLGRGCLDAGEDRRAAAVRADPVLLETDILGVFRRRAAGDPADAARLWELGKVLGQYGHLGEAADGLRGVMERHPTTEVAAGLAWLERAIGGGR